MCSFVPEPPVKATVGPPILEGTGISSSSQIDHTRIDVVNQVTQILQVGELPVQGTDYFLQPQGQAAEGLLKY